MNPLIQRETTILPLLIGLALAWFALSPQIQAVNPPPDGCYPNFTTAEGCNALQFLSAGAGNTGIGSYALYADTTGSYNTGVGGGALALNGGDSNTAVGAAALLFNATAGQSVAVGIYALENNDSSGNGTADNNTAVGAFALEAHIDGTLNTAVGAGAMEIGNGGNDNTAVGALAGLEITGHSNTCLGHSAGSYLTSGEGNIYIGAEVQAGTSGEREFIRIGDDTAFPRPYDTFIAGIYGRSAGPAPLTVMCGSDGKLSANASSRRFKHDIKPMDKASEAILALKPVSFRYNDDSTNTPWYGLVAEDVAKVREDLIVRDKEGKPFGVRYEEVNAMLLNEFLKEHRKVERLTKDFESKLAEQQKQIEALTAGLQKVSAQLEASKPAPQVVTNP